jgi:uncharacterized protein
MQLLIDGYNLAHKLGIKVASQTLVMVRETLEKKLGYYLSKHKCQITIVYDGRGVLSESGHTGKIKTIFTASGETADDYIKLEIDRARSKSSLKVISSDRSIMEYAKVSRVTAVRSEDFLKELLQVGETATTKTPIATSHTLDKREAKPAIPSEQELEEWKKLFGS